MNSPILKRANREPRTANREPRLRLRHALPYFVLFFAVSCRQQILAPQANHARYTIAMKQGGALEYDETVTDSTVLPSQFADSSADFKSLISNAQTTTYHVRVTVPDLSVPYFQTERTITTPSIRDTSKSAATQVWKVKTYGTSCYEYDANNNLINSFSITADTADLEGLPMLAVDTVTANDSMRSIVTTGITYAGQSASTTGTEIIASGPIPNTSSTMTIYLDKTNLTEDSSQVITDGDVNYCSRQTYTTVGGFRIATGIVAITSCSVPSETRTSYEETSNGFDISFLYQSTHVKATTISNIQLP